MLRSTRMLFGAMPDFAAASRAPERSLVQTLPFNSRTSWLICAGDQPGVPPLQLQPWSGAGDLGIFKSPAWGSGGA